MSTWRDGATKDAILDYVARVAGDGRELVPEEQRVAVFDNDGTLWCEKPMPVQLDFILRRLVAMADADPSLRSQQPWKAACERDAEWLTSVVTDHYAGDEHKARTLLTGVLAAYAGISVEDFERRAEAFLRTASNPALERS